MDWIWRGGVSITYQVVGDENPSSTDMSDTIAKLQKRVEGYSTEAIVYQEGSDRINIEIPGVSDANAILQELGRPGTLYFIAQTDDQGNQNYSQQTVQTGRHLRRGVCAEQDRSMNCWRTVPSCGWGRARW